MKYLIKNCIAKWFYTDFVPNIIPIIPNISYKSVRSKLQP